MTKNQIMTYVAAILTTALETEPSPFPESYAYMAMGCDMQKWEQIRGLLIASDLIAIRGNAISLTAKGRDVAQQCNAARAVA